MANLHLRQDKETMNQLKERTDEQIKTILKRMSERVLKIMDDDVSCFDELNDLITSAKIVAKENEENVLLNKNDYDHRYIRMRERQSQILAQMYKIISEIHTTPITAKLISDFLYRIAEEYSTDNDCVDLLKRFDGLNQQLKRAPLPTARNEFEDRARLFGLLRLIEEFLMTKRDFISDMQQ